MRRSDRGATLVEGAFAIPVFFLLVLGLVDFGMMAFEANKATNAARDGARVGIINYEQADVPGSANYEAIKAEIESKLQGRVLSTADLVVECLTPSDVPVACVDATVDEDRINVKVSWNREAISPIAAALGFGSVEVDGDSTMTIVGRPSSGSPSAIPPCEVSTISVTPDPVERFDSGSNAGQLQSDLTVTVTGTGSCSGRALTLFAPDGSSTELCSSGCLGSWTYVGSTDSFWTPGLARAEIVDEEGPSAALFTVTDPAAPTPCSVSTPIVTPNPVQRVVGGSHDGQLVDNLLVNVSATGTCTNLKVTLFAPNSSMSVLCSGASCVGNHGYLAGQDAFWTAGTATVEVTGDDTASGQFTITDAPPCSVTVTVSPQATTSDKNLRLEKAPGESGNTKLRVEVSPSDECENITVTLIASDGVTAFELCSGDCEGTWFYSGNDKVWPVPASGLGIGTIEVTGDATTSTTFEVRKAG